MSQPDTLARALDAGNAWLELGCNVIELPYARIVRSASDVRRPFGYVLRVTARTPDEIDVLLADVARELAGSDRIDYRVDPRTPPQFEARLALEGYACQPLLLMLLEVDLPGSPPDHDLRPVDTDEA